MEYRSISDLSRTVRTNLHRIPRDIDVVVGIPRSGLLAGSVIALALNLPIADLDGFTAGRMLAAGRTRRRAALDKDPSSVRHALVVDDSIRTGAAMIEARKQLSGIEKLKVTYCAIFGSPKSETYADIVLEIMPEPRVFEWNVMHHPLLARSCVDIDGVLCLDPTSAQNDDGDAYVSFLREAQPLYSPTKQIGTLVTSRLERYRAETEAWLSAAEIGYDKLVMLENVDSETRRRLRLHGKFKGEYYRSSSAELFIESDLGQAVDIAKIAGKPVLCTETFTLVRPDDNAIVTKVQRLKTVPGRLPGKARTALKRLLGETGYTRIKGLTGR